MNNIQTCKLTRKFATGENRKYYHGRKCPGADGL